ncbi:MAG: Gfo/Idh/MocA family oxidoreductase [Chloroflexi bacterium]|nr:Gfo/Idh/MocA family oxidoreductase [Chloroflexota bacterium]
MAQRRLKVGVTGAGIAHSPDGRERWAVRAHIPALKALPDMYEVVAVCTTHMATAEESARHFGVPYAFDSVDRMLSELPELDVVCVSVRPVYHYEVTMPALQSGKHVYCEFQMGFNTMQGREIYHLAREKGVRTMLGYQGHYAPSLLHMRELVRQGFIGKPLTFGSSSFGGNYIAPRPSHHQWIFQTEMGGHWGYRSMGALERVMSVLGQDIAALCVDMAVKVPERPALDTGRTIQSDQADNMNYLVRMADGTMGTIQTCLTGWFGTGNRLEIYGTEGMLLLTTSIQRPEWRKETGLGDPTRGVERLYGARVNLERLMTDLTPPELLQGKFEEIPIPDRHVYVSGIAEGRATFGVAQAWAAFHKAVVEDREYSPAFQDGYKIHLLMDAADKSVETRSWVDVDYSSL